MGQRLPRANIKLSVAQDTLAVRAQTIHDGLGSEAGAGYFPTPPITLINYQAFIDAYIAALAAAKTRLDAAVQDKDSKKAILEKATRVLGAYVNQTVNKSEFTDASYEVQKLMIVTSGFILGKDPSPVGPIGKPTNFQAYPPSVNRRPQANKMTLRYDRSSSTPQGGIATIWYWKAVAATTWNQVQTSSARITLSGLTSGPTNFKCIPIGANADTTESDTLTVNVL